MEAMLRKRGVETDFVWAGGETRLNSVIVVEGQGQSTITSSSLRVTSEHLSEFAARYQKALEGASCIVMGGSLPSGVPIEFYSEAIDKAHAHEVPVIFDSSGSSLRAGLKSQPEIIKPNLAELGELLDFLPGSKEEARQAAEKLRDEFGSNVIVTLGMEGAIAVLRDKSYFIQPLSIPVVSSAGAGDGVLAGMALAYLQNEPLEAGLQHGFALAGAILKTLATADFLVEDYQKLLYQICMTLL